MMCDDSLPAPGLGAASDLAEAESAALGAHMKALRDRLHKALAAGLGGTDGSGVRVHGPAEDHLRLPNTLSIGMKGVRGPLSRPQCPFDSLYGHPLPVALT